MSAAEITEQIQRLPKTEKEKVGRFTRLNLEPGQLAGEQLRAPARRMIETNDSERGLPLGTKDYSRLLWRFWGGA